MSGTVTKGMRLAVMSVFSFLLNLGIFALVTGITHWPAEIAAIISIGVVMVVNFLACRYWIFEAQSGALVAQALGFSVATLAFRSAEVLVFSLVYRLTHFNELAVYAGVLLISFVAKLLFYERTVFSAGRQAGR